MMNRKERVKRARRWITSFAAVVLFVKIAVIVSFGFLIFIGSMYVHDNGFENTYNEHVKPVVSRIWEGPAE